MFGDIQSINKEPVVMVEGPHLIGIKAAAGLLAKTSERTKAYCKAIRPGRFAILIRSKEYGTCLLAANDDPIYFSSINTAARVAKEQLGAHTIVLDLMSWEPEERRMFNRN